MCLGAGGVGMKDMHGVSGHLQISESSQVERLTLLMWPQRVGTGLRAGDRY